MTTHRLAGLLALTMLGAVVHQPATARAGSEPWQERRIGFKLRGQAPYTTTRASASESWRSRGGGSLAITMFDWAEVEGGLAAIRAGELTGKEILMQLGLTPPLLDLRDRAGPGLLLQGLGYFGYHYTGIDVGDRGAIHDADVFHSLGFDAGAELTYWFHLRFGLSVRALFDVAIPVAADRESAIEDAEPTRVGLDKDPFMGWTGTIGLAF